MALAWPPFSPVPFRYRPTRRLLSEQPPVAESNSVLEHEPLSVDDLTMLRSQLVPVRLIPVRKAQWPRHRRRTLGLVVSSSFLDPIQGELIEVAAE